jgi:thioredoxin-related protein
MFPWSWFELATDVQELAQKYQVRAMPTFIAFYKGEQVGTVVGADLSKIGELLEQYVASLYGVQFCRKVGMRL